MDYFYIVKFDAAQHDLSEDGPYVMAQILSRYIESEEIEPAKSFVH